MKFWPWLKGALLALAIIGYPVAMHVLLTHPQWPAITLAMGLLPLAIVVLGLLKAGQLKFALLFIALLAVLIDNFWSTLLQRRDLIYLIQNASLDAMLAWIFARTLLPPHEALISQFAKRIHGADFTPAMATYTRQVTWAWALFFVAIAMISVLLFFTAPLSVWSFFVNVLPLPLLAAMFIAEYAARRYCLRDVQHVSIITGASMFWETRAPADNQS
jgi:uncharacterized membrane protein